MNAFWASRSPRDRRLLAIAGVGVVAIVLVAFAWLPLERKRKSLAESVPAQALLLAGMEQQAAEVSRIRSMPAVTPAAATPTATAATALATRLPGAQAAALDDKRIRLTGADLPYGGVLEAIAAAQSGYGMRVDSARIEALPAPGRVRAEIVLARP